MIRYSNLILKLSLLMGQCCPLRQSSPKFLALRTGGERGWICVSGRQACVRSAICVSVRHVCPSLMQMQHACTCLHMAHTSGMRTCTFAHHFRSSVPKGLRLNSGLQPGCWGLLLSGYARTMQ